MWFSRSKGPAGRFELSPCRWEVASPGALSWPFRLRPEAYHRGARRWPHGLVHASAFWLRTRLHGLPAAAREGWRSFSLNLFYSSSLDPAVVAPGRLSLSGPAGPVLAYGPLQATDASGRVVPTQLSLADGQLQIVVYDAAATYPLDIDSLITASRTPVASFSGSSGASFGESVALSADGREALVGAQFANSAYLYTETAGTWHTTPVAAFRGGSGGFGYSVALSADGREALVGAPFTSSNEEGAAYVYKESAGGWPTRPVATLSGRSGDFLGSAVALSADGREALVGAPTAGAGFGGAAYLYAERAGSWPATPIASFPSSNAGESLGSSVALSANGGVALVGTQFARSGVASLTFTLSRPVLGPPPLRRVLPVVGTRASAIRWRCRPAARWRWWAPRSPVRRMGPPTYTPSRPVHGQPSLRRLSPAARARAWGPRWRSRRTA